MPETSEPFAGKELSPRPFTATEQALDNYHEGLALDRDAGASVPSMIASIPDNSFSGASGFSNAFGNLWMRQEWELHRPLRLDEPYEASARIIDIYERRDRTVVNTEMTLRDGSGETAVVARHHQSYLLGQQSGEVRLRDPQKKPGTRRFDVPDGDPIDSIDSTITLEMCGAFFHGARSYHTDRQASEELGFPDVVVGGRMTMSYIGALLEGAFGDPWWRSGKLDVKFTNIVWPGEHVTTKGVITGATEEDASRTGAFAWIEKDDGTIVLIASASVATA